MPPDSVASKVLTLLFTDLAGSTSLKTEKGDKVAGELISRHRDHVAKIAEANSGRIIDWAGDGCFLTFEAPSIAVKFALKLQQTHAEDADLPKVYIGIHMGEVTERSGSEELKVEGLAVDIASRIQALALPGQILMSDAVFNSARQQLDSQELDMPISWQAQGAYIFEGFDDPIQVGEVGIDGISPFESPAGSQKAHRTVTPAEEDTLGWRPAVGQAIPGRRNWIIDSQLGEGGFGEVWLAYNKNTNLKRVYKFCFEPDRLRGLKREVVLLRLLKESLGEREDIARVLDWDIENPPYYIETEYTEGGDLKAWAESQGGLDKVPLETRLELVAQVATALSAAHKAGVLHKDIKPANILIRYAKEDGSPQASLTDFGIGLVTDPNALKDKGITATGLTKTLVASKSTSGSGTALYIAPEILEGELPTHQSDIYSLGVILYQMVIANLKHGISPGWERDVDDELLRKDIAECIDGSSEDRFSDAVSLAQQLHALPERRQNVEKLHKRNRKKKGLLYATAAVTAIAATIFVGIAYNQKTKSEDQKKWAYETALPDIRRHIEEGDYSTAYALALRAKQIIPDDPTLSQYILESSITISFTTEPSGVAFSYKPYSDSNSGWINVGITPVIEHTFPVGIIRFRMQLEGYETIERAARLFRRSDLPRNVKVPIVHINLIRASQIPEGMVRIPAGVFIPALANITPIPVELNSYFIDKTEVSNLKYKEFVRAGGYRNPDYWIHSFKANGRKVSWAEAIKVFVDKTGKPGPSTWELSDYPEGQDDYPVSGVSWYEAAAYAEFREKSLPTIYHWARAALGFNEFGSGLSSVIVPKSNFNGKGPARVGLYDAIAESGIKDMAGNVAEWCLNASSKSRHIMGGNWSDPPYLFTVPAVKSPWDRSSGNGFRCVVYPDIEKISPKAFEDLGFSDYDLYKIPQLPDEALQVYKSRILYPPDAPLDAIQESKRILKDKIIREKVTIRAAYSDERITLYLDIPEGVAPPYKAVIYFPGMNALSEPEYTRYPTFEPWDCIPKSGRAFVAPVYSGMWQRNDGSSLNRLFGNHTREQLVVEWTQDLSRTIDYLESRDDIDTDSVAYLGLSLGSTRSPFLLAIEKRIRLAILQAGGIVPFGKDASGLRRQMLYSTCLNEIDIPVLMVNGKYDTVYPVKTHQKPFLTLLGTLADNKQHIIYNAGHSPFPRGALIRDTLAWLDNYQGPVTKK